MFNIDEIVVSATTLPLVRDSVHPRKAYKERKEKTFHPQHTTSKGYDTNNINNTMETPAVPLSSFKVPEVGDKSIDKECIHRYVCNYIKFTNRNITPTSKNSNKTKNKICL